MAEAEAGATVPQVKEGQGLPATPEIKRKAKSRISLRNSNRNKPCQYPYF